MVIRIPKAWNPGNAAVRSLVLPKPGPALAGPERDVPPSCLCVCVQGWHSLGRRVKSGLFAKSKNRVWPFANSASGPEHKNKHGGQCEWQKTSMDHDWRKQIQTSAERKFPDNFLHILHLTMLEVNEWQVTLRRCFAPLISFPLRCLL